MVCLLIDLTESDLATTWQDKIVSMDVPFKVLFAANAEEATAIINSSTVAPLVIHAKDMSPVLQEILRAYQGAFGPMGDFQVIVNSDPSPQFMASVFEFAVEQFAAEDSWLADVGAVCRAVQEKLDDTVSAEYKTMKLVMSVRSADADQINEAKAAMGDLASYDFRAAYASGKASEASGNYDEAIANYRNATGMNKLFRPVSTSLGEACLITGKVDEAIAIFQKLDRSNPRDVDRKANLAASFVEKGDFETAAKYAAEAESLDPGSSDEIFNFFPVSRIVGKGRAWLEKLPILNMDSVGTTAPSGTSVNTGPPRKIIFYDPNETRFTGFKEILGGYDIELIYAKSLNVAASLIARDADGFGGIYIHEMLNDSSSAEWKNTYGKIPSSSRPPVICGTTAAGAKSTDSLRYIKRPFGMGILVEMMESTFTRASKVAAVAGSGSAISITGTPVSLQAPAKIVGLDETGGVLQMKFPVAKGSRVEIVHPEIVSLIGMQTVVITPVVSLPNQPDVVQARFESIAPGMSKAKYWVKISKILAERAGAIEAAAASAAALEVALAADEPAA